MYSTWTLRLFLSSTSPGVIARRITSLPEQTKLIFWRRFCASTVASTPSLDFALLSIKTVVLQLRDFFWRFEVTFFLFLASLVSDSPFSLALYQQSFKDFFNACRTMRVLLTSTNTLASNSEPTWFFRFTLLLVNYLVLQLFWQNVFVAFMDGVFAAFSRVVWCHTSTSWTLFSKFCPRSVVDFKSSTVTTLFDLKVMITFLSIFSLTKFFVFSWAMKSMTETSICNNSSILSCEMPSNAHYVVLGWFVPLQDLSHR